MRILVCGGREYDDYLTVRNTLDHLIYDGDHTNWEDHTIISGGARGADTLAVRFAQNYGTKLRVFQPDWKRYGKSAGHIRNQQMLDEGKPNKVVAFPGGSGTADMIRRAKKANIEVIEIDS